MSEAVKLGQVMLSHFDKGSISVHPEFGSEVIFPHVTSPGVASIHGTLNLSHHETQTKATAKCSYFIPENWRTTPPHLRCREKWTRTSERGGNPSWHINSDQTLCYVIAPQWADQIKEVESTRGTENAITVAAFHAINNSRWLLYHHLLGYRRNFDKWPAEWPEWPHYMEGIKAYERDVRRGVSFSEK